MSYRECGYSRQEMRPLGTMLRGHLPETVMLDDTKPPSYLQRSGLLSIPASCRNVCRTRSPGRAPCSMEIPAAPIREDGRHHDYALTLRHRRIPREHEAAGPEETPDEADAPGEADAPEEAEASGPEDDERP
jgi:hypothetical protein